jgi:hypothetical protein
MNLNYPKSKPSLIQDADFEKLIPRLRPAEAIHPESSNDFVKPKRKLSKAELTEESSYHEFAWEFLRRNRFYQALVDLRKKSVPETQWGYQWHPDVPRAHGLVHVKPYWEPYQVGDHPSWRGLDSFAEQLPHTTNMKNTSVEVRLRPGQIAVVFDVGNMIASQSPWEKQVWAIEQRLKYLCKNDFNAVPISGKPEHRKVLLRRLKMFDLLSSGTPLNVAANELNLTYQKKKIAKSKNQKPNMFASLAPPKPITTAFDDASAAYRNVYRHGYLSLLRGDDHYILQDKHLVPTTILENNNSMPEDW